VCAGASIPTLPSALSGHLPAINGQRPSFDANKYAPLLERLPSAALLKAGFDPGHTTAPWPGSQLPGLSNCPAFEYRLIINQL